MKIPSSFPRALSFRKALLPVTLGCAAISAHAADDFWNVAGPAAWTDGTNWSLGTAPTNADLAIIKNGGEATVGAGDTITISNLRFINGTVTMTGGSIANTTSDMRIGDYAFDGTIGTANLTMSGSATINANGRLYIADGNGQGSTVSTANVTLSGSATLTNNNDYIVIGRQGGKATVVLNDNAKIEKKGTTNRLIIADGASGIADVTLNDDSSIISAARIDLNGGGTSTVTLNDKSSITATGRIETGAESNSSTGNATVVMNDKSEIKTVDGEIWIGNGSAHTASWTVSGTSTLTKNGTSGFITVARANSTAQLVVEQSGKVISQGSFRLGEGADAKSTVVLRDNANVTIANRLDTSGRSTVSLTMSDNAALNIVGRFDPSAASNFTLTMSGNSAMTVGSAETVAVGTGNGGVATFTLTNSASITASNSKWKVGDYGGVVDATGTTAITLSNNSGIELRELTVGHIGGPTATATVTVNNNAVLKVNNFVTLGRDDNTTNNGMNGRVILNGGTLATSSVRQGGIAAGAEPNATRNSISVNGGTIQALADEADFFQATANNPNRPYVYIDAGGLTFDTQEFSVGIQTVLHGTGDFTKIGGGILTLTGAQDYTGDTFVVDGTLSINTAYLADTSALYLYTGATLDLAFVGTDTIGALYINDVLQSVGVYDAGNLGGFLSGTGSLTVVPEPSVYAAGVLGVLAMSAYVRRRKALKA